MGWSFFQRFDSSDNRAWAIPDILTCTCSAFSLKRAPGHRYLQQERCFNLTKMSSTTLIYSLQWSFTSDLLNLWPPQQSTEHHSPNWRLPWFDSFSSSPSASFISQLSPTSWPRFPTEPESRNVDTFIRSKSFKLNFTPRKVRKSGQFWCFNQIKLMKRIS